MAAPGAGAGPAEAAARVGSRLWEGLREGLRAGAKGLLRRGGYEVRRYHHTTSVAARRWRLIRHHAIDLILDVGANSGQFALECRRAHYRGRIVSFEPLSAAFGELARRAAGDPLWEALNVALGDRHERSLINVSGNSVSSSLLEMLPRLCRTAPQAAYVGQEEITVCTLDALFAGLRRPGERVFLKVDTQGYEAQVIAGAAASLPHLTGVQLELPLVPLYGSEALFADMVRLMEERGFTLMSVEPGLCDPTSGQLLELDGVFFAT